MIQVTPQMRIFLAYESPDFRCGIDGLAAICSEQLKEDPFSGAWFLFRNRKRTSIKALVYDGQGYWLCQKRLSSGCFQWWPKREEQSLDLQACALAAHELQILLWNGNPKDTLDDPLWRPIEPMLVLNSKSLSACEVRPVLRIMP
jgi:transposase